VFLESSKLKLILNFISDYVKVLHVDKFHVPEIVNPLFNICYLCGSVYSHGGVLDYDTLLQCSRWIPVSSVQHTALVLNWKVGRVCRIGGKRNELQKIGVDIGRDC